MQQRSFAVVFGCFTLGYVASFFFRAANAVIARDLSQTFAIGAGELGLMTSLFFVSFAAMQLPVGAALDRYGPRLVTSTVMILAVLGSLLFALAPTFWALAAGRALIGAGMACGLMGLLKAFGGWVAPNRLATISSIAVGIGSFGGLAAASPLAWLNAAVGWRAIFVGAAIFTALAALMIRLFTSDTAPNRAPPLVQATPGVGFGTIFSDVRFWRIAPLNFFMIGTFQAVQTLWGGPYLVDVQQLSKIEAGNPLFVLSLGGALGYFSCGWLADKLGLWRIMPVVVAAFLVSQIVFIIPGYRPPTIVLYGCYLLFGYTASFNLLLLSQIRSLYPLAMSGRATTTVNMFGFIGTALIQGVMGLVIGQFGADAGGGYPPMAYTVAFGSAFVGCVLVIAWYLPLALREGR